MDKISQERIALLHPLIREEVGGLFCQSQNLLPSNKILRITQGLRTFDEQTDLYAQGRTTKGTKVTNAKAGFSYHNYGLAVDLCYIINGKAVWQVDEDFRKIVSQFKSKGFYWGGDFKSFKDYPHFEKGFGYSVGELLSLYNNHQFIPNTTYVNVSPR